MISDMCRYISLALLLLWRCSSAVLGFSLGVDFGTSGLRGCLISTHNDIISEYSLRWEDGKHLRADCAESWITAFNSLLEGFSPAHRRCIQRICVSGTSATALMVDSSTKRVSRPALMYNHNVLAGADATAGARALQCIKEHCPIGSPTSSATSTLAKLLTWHFQYPITATERLMHQADFIAFYLISQHTNSYSNSNGCSIESSSAAAAAPFITSDWHNALKLGYDVSALKYPDWLLSLLHHQQGLGLPVGVLPVVLEPGTAVGGVSEQLKKRFGLHPECTVIAGTTDSIAAFLAAGASSPGEAVTSLGSTLAVKLLSTARVEDSSRGIYSHRLGDQWLVGGASNVGCAVLREEGFSDDELTALSATIDAAEDCELEYYPLLRDSTGERFPFNDPLKQPLLLPKPLLPDGVTVDRRRYLQAILQSIARIEKRGFDALQELGATPVTAVFTAGGGAKNEMWTAMRGRILQKTTTRAENTDAAFGCALLGKKF